MILQRLKRKKIEPFFRSYSQEGEDMVLLRLIGDKTDGFYVDVGAHHPIRFSNTQHYYEKGWKGINFDALPGSMETFKRLRPRDINVEAGVGKKNKLIYYMYDEPAINTFDAKLVKKRKNDMVPYRIIEKRKIDIRPLGSLLDKYLPKNQAIDFLTIDVEGKDYEVLVTNNWQKYKPNYILIECHSLSYAETIKDRRSIFLMNRGYEMIAKTLNTAIFKKV